MVLNNPTFVERFYTRAIHVLDNALSQDNLVSLFEQMRDARRPLLDEHYSRFSMVNRNVAESLDNWHYYTGLIEQYITTRHAYYRTNLETLRNRFN